MSTQKNGTNGTAETNNQNGKPKVDTTATLTVVKDDKKPESTVKGKEIPDLPPVEDRILKVNQLTALVEKHEALLDTRKKLKAFKLSTDGSRDALRIADSKGNEFVTYNSSVIADVLDVLKTSLDKKIGEVEAQIKF